jgi:hypothetical protein
MYQVSCCVGENNAGSQAIIVDLQEKKISRSAPLAMHYFWYFFYASATGLLMH